ncbi:hypothetical protein DY000_02006118 [Brassica cretica]|uniref:Uncharacterized protein n=1 Tax=Brassica cretica TaxID=69181 RepID=A0ABQ7C1L3_BRACR|nr:hypothetical protein DY000_02006118 [Brassica cretica]
MESSEIEIAVTEIADSSRYKRRSTQNNPDATNPSNQNLKPGPSVKPRSILATRPDLSSRSNLDPRPNRSSGLESSQRKAVRRRPNPTSINETNISDPSSQTREEVTELQGMVSSLIDKTRNQEVAYRTILNQLDQTEQELAEHQANARERNQPPSDPLRGSLNPQNTGAFSTPEIPSARSGRYTGENSQRLLQQGLAHRSFSYSGLDEIETGLQGPRSTSIQSQNGYTERPGEPRTRIPPLSHPTSENRTPSATKTFQQTGFGDPIGQAPGYDHRRPIDADPQREDPMMCPGSWISPLEPTSMEANQIKWSSDERVMQFTKPVIFSSRKFGPYGSSSPRLDPYHHGTE